MCSSHRPSQCPKWADRQSHQVWLLNQANRLLDFYQYACINPLGGFVDLDDEGRPLSAGARSPGHQRQLHATTRMVHCFSMAHLMGRPGSDAMIDHGMEFLWTGHKDPVNGGYYWEVGLDGPADDSKQAYGHAFVLLAASSAKAVGHPHADRLLTDISTVVAERFWKEDQGASAEEFTADWQPLSGYCGQNSNMHLTEALMAAFEVTEDASYLVMADRIADLIVHRHAAANAWRLPEHFNDHWEIDRDYAGSPMLRWSRFFGQMAKRESRSYK